MIFTIAGRELRSLFLSPLAWSVLAVVQFILAYLFLAQVDNYLMLQPRLAGVEGAPGVTDIVVAPLFGDAAIVLRVDLRRTTFAHGQQTMMYVIGALVICGLVFGFVTLVLLERVVLRRVTRLDDALRQIGVTGDPDARLPVQGPDELASLAEERDDVEEARHWYERLAQIEPANPEYQDKVTQLAEDAAPKPSPASEAEIQLDDGSPWNEWWDDSAVTMEPGADAWEPLDGGEVAGLDEGVLHRHAAAARDHRGLQTSRRRPARRRRRPEVVRPQRADPSRTGATEATRPARRVRQYSPGNGPRRARRRFAAQSGEARRHRRFGNERGRLFPDRCDGRGVAFLALVQHQSADQRDARRPGDHQAAHGDQGIGTGLGLSIIKHLTELHDGSITVDSVPGTGSVFTVRLPREAKVVPRAAEDAEGEIALDADDSGESKIQVELTV